MERDLRLDQSIEDFLLGPAQILDLRGQIYSSAYYDLMETLNGLCLEYTPLMVYASDRFDDEIKRSLRKTKHLVLLQKMNTGSEPHTFHKYADYLISLGRKVIYYQNSNIRELCISDTTLHDPKTMESLISEHHEDTETFMTVKAFCVEHGKNYPLIGSVRIPDHKLVSICQHIEKELSKIQNH